MARATTGLSYLTFGVVLLGSLVFTIFVSVPQWGLYSDANAKLKMALQQEKDNQVFLADLDLRTQELGKYSADAKALSVALPDRFMQSSLWVNISELATKAGVVVVQIGESKKDTTVQSTTVEPATANAIFTNEGEAVVKTTLNTNAASQRLEKWTTGLQVKGNYSQIRAFVKNLENSMILSDLKEFKLTPATSGNEAATTDVMDATMTIRTYVQL